MINNMPPEIEALINQLFTPEQEAELEKLLQAAEKNKQEFEKLLDYGDKMIARHRQERQNMAITRQPSNPL